MTWEQLDRFVDSKGFRFLQGFVMGMGVTTVFYHLMLIGWL